MRLRRIDLPGAAARKLAMTCCILAQPLLLAGCDVYQAVIINKTSEPVHIASKGGKGCDVEGLINPQQNLFLECDPRTITLEVSGASIGKCIVGPDRVRSISVKYKTDDSALLTSGQDTQREIPIAQGICR